MRPPVFAVADGMGGHQGGEVASQLTVEHIREVADVAPVPDQAHMVAAIERANTTIRRDARAHPDLYGMGTTCTAVVVDVAIRIVHVGDSRAYRFRDGRLDQLTEDHSLVASLVRAGNLGASEARTDGRRNIVTRALGAEDEVRVDRVETDRASGDRVIICTDGLSGQVSDEAIARVLAETATPARAADRLVELANAAGGEDNVTVIVIDVDAVAAAARVAGSLDMALGDVGGPAGSRPVASGSIDARGHMPRRRITVAVVIVAALIVVGFALALFAPR